MRSQTAVRQWWLAQVLCLVFGGVFIFAGWQKALDPTQFLENIRGFQLVPDPFAAWMALMLPWLEIFAGAAVIIGWLRKGGLLLLNGLILVFIVSLSTAWARGLDIECGCFGAVKTGTILQELGLNLVLLPVAIWLLVGVQPLGCQSK